ncbi:class IV adenylate cyclase [bacterium (Candidatus Gribaldobacteria) CG_4_8_14_3_um_filter_42_11]|uniref:Class IV adenylate cyclase n=1 Tax=bacterium (Candidatus Gribaldobacteria) CG_4_8_14_3_um_filter_42_11 TaxID=2014267 RepID=A0A2M7IXU7_9BACT|nr:MAG: class IV adenylate cyclase [bacterium (Candidatus Gribaldobacteria) CG_4_8_14_3_um_filter_42_11]
MPKDIEIEIQVNVEKIEPLLEFLTKSGQFVGEKHQVDEYFTPTHRDFLAVRPAVEWLRLRNSDGIFYFNYKNWHLDEQGKSHYCDEYETKIDDTDQLKKILQVLNFQSLVKVDKSRKIYLYQDYEVAIDKVAGLSDFVEIEYKGASPAVDPKMITNEMVKFLKDLGCGEIKRNYSGYPFILLCPDEVQYETL